MSAPIYRIRFESISPDNGTHYYAVQCLGLFGNWLPVARSLKLEEAKGLILTLRAIDAARAEEAKP